MYVDADFVKNAVVEEIVLGLREARDRQGK
jgi:hypothetical protein